MTVKPKSKLERLSNSDSEEKQNKLSFKILKLETQIGELEKKASAISSLMASSSDYKDSFDDYFDKNISYINGQITRILGERLIELTNLGATSEYISFIIKKCDGIMDSLETLYSDCIQIRALEFKDAARKRSERVRKHPKSTYHLKEYSATVTRRGSDESGEGVHSALTQIYERLD